MVLFEMYPPRKKAGGEVSGFKPQDLSSLLLAMRLALTIVLPIVAALLLGRHLGRICSFEALFP